MGYFQVRYDSRVVIYDHRAFIRLATGEPPMKGSFEVVTLPIGHHGYVDIDDLTRKGKYFPYMGLELTYSQLRTKT